MNHLLLHVIREGGRLTTGEYLRDKKKMRRFGLTRLSRALSAEFVGGRWCSDASEEVALLRREVKELRRELSSRAETIRQLMHMTRSDKQHGGDGDRTLVAVEDDEQLERALKVASPRVLLLPGRDYSLLPAPFVVRGEKRIEIVGAAALTASFKLSDGASLSMNEVQLVSHAPSLPAVEASGSIVMLANCTIRGGRDGVYLSSGSHLTCTRCRFEGNARGVFEGFRCAIHLAENTFENNLFHLVLLSSASHKRVEEVQLTNSFAGERTRGDVVFQYNPVSDHYSDIFRGGVPVVLTEEHSTANLVDPTW